MTKVTRITPLQKKIADAHMEAFKNKKFDNAPVTSATDLILKMKEGKTFEQVYAAIETRYCSVGSTVIAALSFTDNHMSKNYKAGIYKGFKTELTTWGIN